MAVGQDKLESIFQVCLEMIQSGQETVDSALSRYPDQADAMRPALEALSWLQGQGRLFDPRPGFVESSRRRLSTRIRQEIASPSPLMKNWAAFLAWFLRPKRLGLQFILISILMIGLVIGAGGVAVASRSSIPGDALYPMKIAAENAQLALTPGQVGEAQLYIEFSQHRLQEVQELVLEGKYQYIPQTVSEFNRQVGQATQLLKIVAEENDPRVASLAVLLKNNLVHQSQMLAVLNGAIPDGVKPDFELLNSVVADGISMAEEVINSVPLPPASTTPSEVPAVATSGLPVVATPLPSLTPTDTLKPSLASSMTPAPTSTPTVSDLNVIITPSPVPLRKQITSTPTPTRTETKEPKPTRRPTRPPHPSKTPKPGPKMAPIGRSSLPDLEPW